MPLVAALLLALGTAAGEGDPRRAQAFLEKAVKALEAGDVSKAQELLEQARELDPRLPQPEILLGQIAMSQARYAEAESAPSSCRSPCRTSWSNIGG
jgi:Tfp pilus assembly protein PilF